MLIGADHIFFINWKSNYKITPRLALDQDEELQVNSTKFDNIKEYKPSIYYIVLSR